MNLNDGQSYCQPGYFYLPTGWVLAPDNSDSKSTIFLNTWSTYTVVVASGVGYFSKSSYGSINKANNKWLLSTFSSQFGYTYSCYPCNCEILIMYLPRTPTPSMMPSCCLPYVYHYLLFLFFFFVWSVEFAVPAVCVAFFLFLLYLCLHYSLPPSCQRHAVTEADPSSIGGECYWILRAAHDEPQ